MTGKRTERGQAIILIVFAIIGLIGITALVVDGGNTYLEKRRAQNAADTTALGGALARIRDDSTWVSKTYEIAAANGYNNDSESNVVTVSSPPLSGPNAGNIEYIQVFITSSVRTYFAGVIGFQETTVQVEAVSRTKTPEVRPILNGDAVISLAPESDCENKKAFWVHGEATLDITGAGVFVNSNNDECALIQQGSGSIRLKGDSISVVGNVSIQKPQLITPYPPLVNVPPISYPPPFMMPKIGCPGDAFILEDGATMTPGAWGDSDFPPPGVHYLESGIYCIEQDFILNGGDHLEGNNVVFVVKDGDVRWAGDAHIDLDAPNSGNYAGLLLYAPIENRNVIVLNGNADSAIKGTILAPGAEIRINGNSSTSGFHSQIIGYRVDVDGQSNIVIKYLDEQNYDALSMPEIELSK